MATAIRLLCHFILLHDFGILFVGQHWLCVGRYSVPDDLHAVHCDYRAGRYTEHFLQSAGGEYLHFMNTTITPTNPSRSFRITEFVHLIGFLLRLALHHAHGAAGCAIDIFERIQRFDGDQRFEIWHRNDYRRYDFVCYHWVFV